MSETTVLFYDTPAQIASNTAYANYWQYYQLKQSPFEDAPQFAMYYPVMQWQAHYRFLHQFVDGTNPLLLIEGELGIGKTMLLAQFTSQLPEGITHYRIKAHTNMSSPQLVAEIAQGFQLPGALMQSSWQEQLNSEIAMMQELQKTFLLVVDDADLLPPDTLNTLVQLATSQDPSRIYCYLILTSELQLQNHLENIAADSDNPLRIHTIRVNPLSLDETKNYIKFRLTKAGLNSKMPLSKESLDSIYHLSGGVPGRVNRVAQQILIDNLKPNEERIPARKKNNANILAAIYQHPLRYGSAAILLALAGLSVWKMDALPHHVMAANISVRPLVQVAQTYSAAPVISANNNSAVAVAPVKPAAQNTITVAVAPTNNVTAVSSAEPVNSLATSAIANSQRSNVATIAPVAVNNNVAAPTINNVTTAPLNTQPAQSATPVSTSAITPHVAATPANPVKKAIAHHAPAAKAAMPAATAKNLTADEKHLLTLQGYTLQISGAHNAEMLQQFVKKAGLDASQAQIFRTTFQGKPWTVLVYGNYSSPQAARNVIANLPAKAQALKPWVRPMSSVHSAINQSN